MRTLCIILLFIATTNVKSQVQPLYQIGDTTPYSGKLILFYPDSTKPTTDNFYKFYSLYYHVGFDPGLFAPDSSKKRFEATFVNGYESPWFSSKAWFPNGTVQSAVYFDSLTKHKISEQYYLNGLNSYTRIDTFYSNGQGHGQDIILEKYFEPTGKIGIESVYYYGKDKTTVTKIMTEYYESGRKHGETKYLEYIDATDNRWKEKLIYSKTWNEKGQLIKLK